MGGDFLSRGRVMADADVLADFLKGRGAAERVEALLRERRLSMSVIAAFEVWCGLRTPEGRAAFRKVVRVTAIVPLDRATAERAGEVYRDAEEAGARVAHRDALIAAAALLRRLPLLTRNVAHFARVPGLELAPLD
jgi:predicted nucleic acid-binding protein